MKGAPGFTRDYELGSRLLSQCNRRALLVVGNFACPIDFRLMPVTKAGGSAGSTPAFKVPVSGLCRCKVAWVGR